jgi:predicted small secreted protein
MTRHARRILTLAALIALSGCATVQGLGQDIETTGRVIQRTF